MFLTVYKEYCAGPPGHCVFSLYITFKTNIILKYLVDFDLFFLFPNLKTLNTHHNLPLSPLTLHLCMVPWRSRRHNDKIIMIMI